ncbi:hypothetical protein NFI96_024130, partial [Prochilodus magdalenae]
FKVLTRPPASASAMLVILAFIILFHIISAILIFIATTSNAWWFVTEGQFYTDLWYRCNITCKEIPGSATADAAPCPQVRANADSRFCVMDRLSSGSAGDHDPLHHQIAMWLSYGFFDRSSLPLFIRLNARARDSCSRPSFPACYCLVRLLHTSPALAARPTSLSAAVPTALVTGCPLTTPSLCVMIAASIYTAERANFQAKEVKTGEYGYAFVVAWVAFPMTFISGLMYLVLRKRKGGSTLENPFPHLKASDVTLLKLSPAPLKAFVSSRPLMSRVDVPKRQRNGSCFAGQNGLYVAVRSIASVDVLPDDDEVKHLGSADHHEGATLQAHEDQTAESLGRTTPMVFHLEKVPSLSSWVTYM